MYFVRCIVSVLHITSVQCRYVGSSNVTRGSWRVRGRVSCPGLVLGWAGPGLVLGWAGPGLVPVLAIAGPGLGLGWAGPGLVPVAARAQ